MIRVTIFNEYWHENSEKEIKEVYPSGIHGAIAEFLGKENDITVQTVALCDEDLSVHPDRITKELLENTDVLLWWGHVKHGDVPDSIALMVRDQVQCGMGAIFLHSAHFSKPFKYLMGTSCTLDWRIGEKERLWNVCPSHPIMQGVEKYIDLEQEEMYSEVFDIPTPDELLMIGTYESHEVFRSACTWRRGYGKVFYFQPGHESFPTYYNVQIQRILKNAIRWAAPTYRRAELDAIHAKRIEL